MPVVSKGHGTAQAARLLAPSINTPRVTHAPLYKQRGIPSYIKFLDGADTQIFATFWQSVTGTVATVASPFAQGVKATQCSATATPSYAFATTPPAVVADAGGRLSFLYQFTGGTQSGHFNNILELLTPSSTPVVTVSQFSDGTLWIGSGAAGSAVALAASTTYRISLAWVVNSVGSYTIKLWIDGVLQRTETNSPALSNVGMDKVNIGNAGNWLAANGTITVAHLYIDSDTTLTDPGNVRVTYKLPAGLGAQNNFPTLNGTGAARYNYVSERPANQANYISDSGGTQHLENFTIQAASVGDNDISGLSTLGYAYVVLCAVGAGVQNTGPTGVGFTLNGITYDRSISTTPDIYVDHVKDTAYPSNAAGIGLRSNGGTAPTNLYECGVLIAYIPSVVTTQAISGTAPSGARASGTPARPVAARTSPGGLIVGGTTRRGFSALVPARGIASGLSRAAQTGTSPARGTVSGMPMRPASGRVPGLSNATRVTVTPRPMTATAQGKGVAGGLARPYAQGIIPGKGAVSGLARPDTQGKSAGAARVSAVPALRSLSGQAPGLSAARRVTITPRPMTATSQGGGSASGLAKPQAQGTARGAAAPSGLARPRTQGTAPAQGTLSLRAAAKALSGSAQGRGAGTANLNAPSLIAVTGRAVGSAIARASASLRFVGTAQGRGSAVVSPKTTAQGTVRGYGSVSGTARPRTQGTAPGVGASRMAQTSKALAGTAQGRGAAFLTALRRLQGTAQGKASGSGSFTAPNLIAVAGKAAGQALARATALAGIRGQAAGTGRAALRQTTQSVSGTGQGRTKAGGLLQTTGMIALAGRTVAGGAARASVSVGLRGLSMGKSLLSSLLQLLSGLNHPGTGYPSDTFTQSGYPADTVLYSARPTDGSPYAGTPTDGLLYKGAPTDAAVATGAPTDKGDS